MLSVIMMNVMMLSAVALYSGTNLPSLELKLKPTAKQYMKLSSVSLCVPQCNTDTINMLCHFIILKLSSIQSFYAIIMK
jgi:hypothetical protein